jgi:UDPglucose 6-dehydrogenase
MNVCVLGLCHLGSVTAACLATLGHRVVGIDFDEARVANLSNGIAPIHEPGLEELIKRGLSSGNLRFSATVNDAKDIDVLWVAYDTPVDDDDHADADFVMAQIERALLGMSPDVVVLVSSQLPVGSVRRLEQAAALNRGAAHLRLAYSPENLRLGSAVGDFLRPKRIVVGVRSSRDRELLHGLLSSITGSIEWMSVESAEMTKHAVNAFLAASVAFANEIASICESVGADAKEVERGLKTEDRIGPRAYLSPGAAFAGGTLARDIGFLNRTAHDHGLTTPLLSSVLPSNDAHKRWVQRRLRALFVDLSRTTVAVWGLTYKPDTDTLRRSLSVELCDWLIREGATVHVHDPVVKSLPQHWCGAVKRFDQPIAAVHGADALIMATEWPIYRTIAADQLIQCADRLVVLDANRFLTNVAAAEGRVQYFAVGMPFKDT